MERIQVVGDILYQGHINFDRNIILIQRAVQRRFVIACAGVKHVFFHIRIKLRTERPFEYVKNFPESLKYRFSVTSVRQGTIAGVSGLIQMCFCAVA